MTKETLANIISNGRESSSVDFKCEFYGSLSSSDLPKDIAAFANDISYTPKVLVFGIDDQTRKCVGINTASLPTQDSLDDFISKTIEPFVATEMGAYELDDCEIGYIELLESNTDRPYVIKKDCGKNNSIKKGDIFVRKGSSIQKASREDIDTFRKKGRVSIKIHDGISIIEPINFLDELIKTPTYGRIDVEFYNGSAEPILIDDGRIFVSTSRHSIYQRIVSILPTRDIQERPFELPSMTRKVYTLLYSFLSGDCVGFGFDSDGNLREEATVRIELKDTDSNIYKTDEINILLKAKGDILHKVWLKEKQEHPESFTVKIKKILKR